MSVEENVFYNKDISENMIVLLIINVHNYVIFMNVKIKDLNVINLMAIKNNIFVENQIIYVDKNVL